LYLGIGWLFLTIAARLDDDAPRYALLYFGAWPFFAVGLAILGVQRLLALWVEWVSKQ
jgi:hypothetical protein